MSAKRVSDGSKYSQRGEPTCSPASWSYSSCPSKQVLKEANMTNHIECRFAPLSFMRRNDAVSQLWKHGPPRRGLYGFAGDPP